MPVSAAVEKPAVVARASSIAPTHAEPAGFVKSFAASASSASVSSEALERTSLKQESARDVARTDSVDLVSAAKALSQATMAAAQAVGKPGV
jgi:hypothetical protein